MAIVSAASTLLVGKVKEKCIEREENDLGMELSGMEQIIWKLRLSGEFWVATCACSGEHMGSYKGFDIMDIRWKGWLAMTVIEVSAVFRRGTKPYVAYQPCDRLDVERVEECMCVCLCVICRVRMSIYWTGMCMSSHLGRVPKIRDVHHGLLSLVDPFYDSWTYMYSSYIVYHG